MLALCERHRAISRKKVSTNVTGGEAVDIGMKLARWYTGKPIIITHRGDYHGPHGGSVALTAKAFMMAYMTLVPLA